MFFAKPVLAVIAVFFLGSIAFALVSQSQVSKLRSDKKELQAQLRNATEESTTTAALDEKFKGLSDKLDEVIKNQQEAAQQQATTPTPSEEMKKQNTVTQDNLRAALKDADKIYKQGKDYAKVTPAAAKLIDPDFKWTNKLSDAPDKISITKAKKEILQLCALSDSSTFFCLQSDKGRGGGTTYGQGDTQAAALRALASDGWDETSGNTQGQQLPFNSKKQGKAPKVE